MINPGWLERRRTTEADQAALAADPLTAPVHVTEGPLADSTCSPPLENKH